MGLLLFFFGFIGFFINRASLVNSIFFSSISMFKCFYSFSTCRSTKE